VFAVFAVFNSFLGEELLFRGVLLPRMNAVFGRWDWLANGVVFGAYHLHQPVAWSGSLTKISPRVPSCAPPTDRAVAV
jgi:membrane protease YdiL (CAAX protease family)